MELSDIGMIGMAVMGENLSMNMEDKGFRVSVFDVRDGIVDSFAAGRGKGKNFFPAHSYPEFVNSIKKPRKIMMMIRAGDPVDQVIASLVPLLDKGDIVIDGGNSRFTDTVRRAGYLESLGFRFIGTGVSGGEEGALNGPSLMPGGSREAWEEIRPVFHAICAKTDDGSPCCDYVGQDGAGHFVKMVHNGIEYGDMQIISEVYHLMSAYMGLDNEQMSAIFSEWNRGKLDSYLIKITSEILRFKEPDGSYLVDKVLDAAGQKGTGKWACFAALDEGIPLTMIAEAVFARCLSSQKEERERASKALTGASGRFSGDPAEFINDLENALYAAKIISYAQGYALMRDAAGEYNWDLNYGGIALMWRGGCIIRSVFLGKIREAYEKNGELENLMLDGYFRDQLASCEGSLRRVCGAAVASGVPVPALSAALAYYDGYRCGRLPANLLQAQRDYFGAHTYERTDRPRGEHFHTDWTAANGDEGSGSAASTFYNV